MGRIHLGVDPRQVMVAYVAVAHYVAKVLPFQPQMSLSDQLINSLRGDCEISGFDQKLF